jgi:hypothetical protein
VDASQNVGIGTASPGVRLEVSGASAASSFNALRMANTDTTASSPVTTLFQSADDGTLRNRATMTSGSDGSNNGYIALSTRSSGSITEKFRLNSTGALVLAGGSTSANGTGITFPAAINASSDVNTLDDYEEGVWTPNQGNGLILVGAFSSAGYYTKIGNVVTISGFVKGATSVACSAAGTICTNAPFAGGVAGIFWTGSVLSWSADSGASCAVQQDTSNIYNGTAVAASDRISFSITYRT